MITSKGKKVKTLFEAFEKAGQLETFRGGEKEEPESLKHQAKAKKRKLIIPQSQIIELCSSEEEAIEKELTEDSSVIKFKKHLAKEILNSTNGNRAGDKISSSSGGLKIISPKETSLKDHLKEIELNTVVLGEEQNIILDLIVNKEKSVFFTGPAGSGKTVLLREIIKQLKEKYKTPAEAVAVTATTGLAGLNIGGKTYHSHFGLGLGDANYKVLVKRISKRSDVVKVWKNCKVLIIDEISLVDSRMLSKLAGIAQHFKKSMLPFGGIQLVFVGDFFQLPPVVGSYTHLVEANIVKNYEEYKEYLQNLYAFKAPEWNKCLHYQISLKKVYRQMSDPDFIRFLNEVRAGVVSDEADIALSKLSRELEKIEGIEPSQLYPTKKEANLFNSLKLNSLPGQAVTYSSEESGRMMGTDVFRKISNSFLAPNQISLKVGAQVMLIKNYSKDLVNGSLGVVVDFIDETNFVNITEGNRSPKGKFGFLEKDKDLEMLSILQKSSSGSDNKEDIWEGIFNEVKSSYNFNTYPVVRFISKLDNTSQLKVVLPHNFDFLDQKTEQVLVRKRQIPLILAWALSVHKSQGQTYNLLKVDISKTFEVGQVYVALSRVTSRKGLQIVGWNRRKVLTHSLVKEFYKNIKSVQQVKVSLSTALKTFESDQLSASAPRLLESDHKYTVPGDYVKLSQLSEFLGDSE